MLHAGGAKSKQPNYNQQKQYPQTEKERRNDKEGNSQIRHHQQGHNRQPFKKYLLNFNGVKKMMEENTEPHIVVKKFAKETTGLEEFLKSNSTNWEVTELILAVLGNFCLNKGVMLFHNAFIKFVQILAVNSVFANLETVVLHIPKARSTNLGSKEERLTRLIKSISYLTTEMLTVMPALTCDYLGERFFEDVCALKALPSIRDLNVSNAFDALEKEGADRLKVCNHV
jgi:hypothetical protein